VCLLYEEGPQRFLFVVFRGPEEVADDGAVNLSRIAAGAGAPEPRAIDEDLTPADPGTDDIIVRFSAPAGEAWHLHSEVAATGAAASLRTLPGVSRVDAFCEDEDAALVLLAWARKTLTPYAVLQAPLSLRSRPDVDLWRPLPQSFPLMQRLKEALDPSTILNPGRFVGRL
jgi:hypothetical protein